jgi:hypothetical protein
MANRKERRAARESSPLRDYEVMLSSGLKLPPDEITALLGMLYERYPTIPDDKVMFQIVRSKLVGPTMLTADQDTKRITIGTLADEPEEENGRIPLHAWPTMWMTEDEVTQLNRAYTKALLKIENFMEHACEISARLGLAPEAIDFPYVTWMNHHVTLTNNRLPEPMMSVEIRLDRAGGADAATRKVAEYARDEGLACRVMNGNDEIPDFLRAAA